MRHDLFHEFFRFVVGLFVVDQDLADIVGQIVAECPNNRIALAINQKRRRASNHDFLNGFPDGKEIFDIPFEFFGTAINACRPQDYAHSLGNIDLMQ